MQNVATRSRVPQINIELEYLAAQKSTKQLQILNSSDPASHMQLNSKLLSTS